MGLFEKVGRRVERFKQRASEAAREEADYECADCGTPLYADAEACPDCGAEAVVERASTGDAEDASGDDPTDAASGSEGRGDDAGDGGA